MKRYLTILNLLLVTGLVFLGVKIFFKTTTAKLAYTPPVADRPAENGPGAVTQTQQPLAQYNAIADRDLFKTGPEVVDTSQEVNIEELKQTELNLKLWGTVARQSGKTYAVIEDTKKREQNLYQVGDTVQDAMVKMVLREKVVLSVNGKDEVLEMEKLESTSAAAAPGAPSDRPPAQTRARKIALKRDQIEGAVSDLNSLMSQVKIRPHFKDGQPDGIALSNIRSNSIFRKMGLRNGDILMGVNDQNIQSVDDALGFYNNLKSSNNVSLKIKRRGRLNTIEYTIE
ncbi:type II secretion system protein GspC [Thermodesulfobacteriota bacterium]